MRSTSASCRPQGWVNQDRRSSSPSVAEVKIQVLPAWAGPSKRSDTACAMSSGDSTSLACRPTSSQRTASGRPWPEKCTKVSANCLARSCKRTKSGANSVTVSRARAVASAAWLAWSSASVHSALSSPSGTASVQRRRAPTGARPMVRRSSRAARSKRAATACQSTRPRASCKPVASTSCDKSSSCAVLRLRPKNWMPVSLS